MRNIFMLLIFTVSSSALAGINYDTYVDMPITALNFSKAEISHAAEESLKNYNWSVTNKSETSIEANYRGKTPLIVSFPDDMKITIQYKGKIRGHKFYRRLLTLKRLTLTTLTDCSLKGQPELDANTKLRRNLVYSLTKAGWVIKKLSENRIVAKSPGNGRVEVDVYDGSYKMQRWDEIEGEYTDPDDDGYLAKVKRVYNRQVGRCAN